MNGIFVLDHEARKKIYSPEMVQQLAEKLSFPLPATSTPELLEQPALLREIDVIFSGWGAPHFDAELLAHAPRLQAVFYGAGSVKGLVSDAFWDRDILITSAYAANAVPVAEYTLSQILFSLKLGWRITRETKEKGAYQERPTLPGAYGTTVGLISLGMIGRLVAEHLQRFDVRVIAYDPFCPPSEAADLGVELHDLGDVFATAHVVSLHTPWLKETENMIRAKHFRAMQANATFINTARGAVVCESDMIEVLQERPDLQAILDVTYPEPPVPGSPLFTLPNVVLTPHIAGSTDRECYRMGQYMVDELHRYLAGQPLKWQITREQAAKLA